MRGKGLLFTLVLGFVCMTVLQAEELRVVQPFEGTEWPVPANVIDVQVMSALQEQGASLRNPCSDGVFIRRVYLDVIGTLPKPEDVDAFLKDTSPGKRTRLIEDLLWRDEFADYWSMKWCDLLRVKSEFPINLWPNAVQAYHQWIRDSIRRNQPYDEFARELLTSSGSNFRVPPVNFYRAVQGRDSSSIAKAAALTFMGSRMERWPEKQRSNMAAIFSRVAYKKTREWKEEIVYLNPEKTASMKVTFPDGSRITIPSGSDPRKAFADWLISPKNKWFSRNITNRIWAWLMGTGIINEPDDIRPDNLPASPEVLSCLENELIKSNYDLRHIYRLILNSRTYQQSSVPCGDVDKPETKFARYRIRQLEAEVLLDALCRIGGEGEGYVSPIPEPFTFIPKEQRSITLADGSITSAFLMTFGRSPRDTGLESERNNRPTDAQRLYLLNSGDIQRRIENSYILAYILSQTSNNPAAALRFIYLTILSREPTPDEAAAIMRYTTEKYLAPRQAVNDVTWALVNSKEFLYRH